MHWSDTPLHQPISQRASSCLHKIAEHRPTTACPRSLASKIAVLRRARTPKHPTYSPWRAAAQTGAAVLGHRPSAHTAWRLGRMPELDADETLLQRTVCCAD